jgi:hypothetical protein
LRARPVQGIPAIRHSGAVGLATSSARSGRPG